jgi:hypothetical protein
MPQLGILFDAQKLGTGFYGYTAFRILFSVIPMRDLASCTLYHGEVGEQRIRPYCIVIDCASQATLSRFKQALGASMARGLMPQHQRFLDESLLHEEVLALAAHISSDGEMTDCPSRWLQEAWQRSQAQAATHAHPEARQPRASHETKTSFKLPEKPPIALRWSSGGRRALALLFGCCAAGAAVPWTGWGLSLCLLFFVAGIIHACSIWWRMSAEESLSSEELLAEVKKMAAAKTVQDIAEKLNSAGCQASPLLRRVQVASRSADLSGACLLADQQDAADAAELRAELMELRWHAFASAACCILSVLGMYAFQGTANETPRLALAGAVSFLSLTGAASLFALRGERFRSYLYRTLSSQWYPSMMKAQPQKIQDYQSLDKALLQISEEFQALRASQDRRRDGDLVDTIASLRGSIDQLTPILAGFREPFVLQAVPMPPRKAMSATA